MAILNNIGNLTKNLHHYVLLSTKINVVYYRIPRDGCEEAIFIIRERTSFKEDNSVSCDDAKINDKGTIIFVADSPEGIFRQYKMRTVADEQKILS